MYILKVCRCCDAIIGELDTDDAGAHAMMDNFELVGNVAYTVCPHCMQELAGNKMRCLH